MSFTLEVASVAQLKRALALDPYSPTFPTRAPEWNDPNPLAVDPYSPILPVREANRKI